MYLTNNLIVLGAGASKEYGMPLGSELREYILSSTSNYQLQSEIVKLAGDYLAMYAKENPKLEINLSLFDEADVRSFVIKFTRSRNLSIDAELQKYFRLDNFRMLAIGKAFIAKKIYTEELKAVKAYHSGWIEDFISFYVKGNIDGFFENPPKIISFNYDMIFERFLVDYISSEIGSRTEALAKVRDLGVIHVYGDTGLETDLDKPSDISSIMMDIHTIRGSFGESDNIKKANEAMLEALGNSHKIYFLGFGFDTTNCELLLKDWRNRNVSRDIYCTLYKHNPNKVKMAIQVANNMFRFNLHQKNGYPHQLLDEYPLKIHKD